MTLMRWNPMQQLASMEVDRLNRMFDRVLGDESGRRGWLPPVDIHDDEQRRVVIRAELPGMKREDIHVSVENDTLTLSGERQASEEIRRDRFHRLERSCGRFSRSFTLPATLDAGQIEATYENGVLTISIPPREEAKPKQIKVEVR